MATMTEIEKIRESLEYMRDAFCEKQYHDMTSLGEKRLNERRYSANEEAILAALSNLEHSGWASVKERLPPTEHYILVATKQGEVKKVIFDGRDYAIDSRLGTTMRDWGYTVTHWMPLPPAPKEEPHE